jgi:hypothetical protein
MTKIISVAITALLISAACAIAQVLYVQQQYYWIPRVWGQDQETGAYAAYPAGAWQWIGDQDPATIPFTPAPGLQQRAMHLPATFPRKAYLSRILVAYGSSAAVGSNELSCWVDPGGAFFHTGTPNGREIGSNFVNVIQLFSQLYSGASIRDDHKIDPPILLDRDAGDLLGCKLGSSQTMDWIFIGFRWLAPNPNPTLP